MEQLYKNTDYSKLFLYFFEVYRIALTKGVATDEFAYTVKQCPSLEFDDGIVSEYMQNGLLLLSGGYPPSVLSLFLERMYSEQCANKATAEQTHMIELSRRLIQSLHVLDLQALLDMSCLWSDETALFASTHFYLSLPQHIIDKYNLP